MYVRPENHKCFLQPVKTTKRESEEEESHTNFLNDNVAVENDVQDRQEQNLIFFDFECTQDQGEHIPNLCVAQNESGEEFVFSGRSTKDEFCKWVFDDKNASTTFVAHNFQAYDGYFILQYLYKNGITPEIITRGAKILSLTVPEMNIKFIDSLCFIPMIQRHLVSPNPRRFISPISSTVLKTRNMLDLFQTPSSTIPMV